MASSQPPLLFPSPVNFPGSSPANPRANSPAKTTAKPRANNLATALTRLSAAVEAALSTYALLALFLSFYTLTLALMWLWGFHGELKHLPNHFPGPAFRYIIGVARGAGYTLNLNTSLVLLLAARFSFTALRDTPLAAVLPLDNAFPFLHVVVAYATVVGVVLHATFHFGWLVGWNSWDDWGLWSFNMSVVTGGLLSAVFLAMFILAIPAFRRRHFIAFYRVHLVGATLFYGLLIIHGMYRRRPETYKYIIPSLLIYAFDRYLRHSRASLTTVSLSSTNSLFNGSSILELRVPKPFAYQAGQYVELQVPSINREWHPFTIASAPHEVTLAVYIKKLGDWTAALHCTFERIAENQESSVTVKVRGPYGAPCQHVRGYDRVVLISGGIGATPFSAVCKMIHHLQKSRGFRRTVTDRGARLNTDAAITAAERNVIQVISQLYNVNVEAAMNEIFAIDEQRSAFVTDMLRYNSRRSQALRAGSSMRAALLEGYTSDDEQESIDEEEGIAQASHAERELPAVRLARKYVSGSNPMAVILAEKAGKRQQMLQLFDVRAQMLATLHTTWMQFLLLLLLMARVGVVSAGSIWGSTFVSVMMTALPTVATGQWVVIADTFLSAIVMVLFTLTIVLEISFHQTCFFTRTAHILDVALFLPTAVATFALNVDAYVRGAPISSGVIALHYVVFIPIQFALMLSRLRGTLGGRRLTDGGCEATRRCNDGDSVPDVDFVWTSAMSDDDLWLRQELEPLAEGTQLRLHRYITREKSLDAENGAGCGLLSKTRLGRPVWDDVFAEVAARAKSDATVGVFFCGPHRMGATIRKSLRKVEVVSALKGAYLRGVGWKTVARDLGVSRDVVCALRLHGCSVRFVFREENFS
ncbi:unnamed protein product [Agarophyton chilense]